MFEQSLVARFARLMDRISLCSDLDIEEEDEERSCSLSIYLADFACEKEGICLASFAFFSKCKSFIFFLFLIWARW